MATADDGTRAGSSAEDAALPRAVGRPRYRKLDRTQLRFQGESLNQLLPPDHPTRLLWSMVSEWDLSKFEAVIEAVAGRPGAPAFDPRVLLTLWIQAILDGYGSARELADLCRTHLVYRWICGDEPVNHHTFSSFPTSSLGTHVANVIVRDDLAFARYSIGTDNLRVPVMPRPEA